MIREREREHGFCARQFAIHAAGREVASWDQPLIDSDGVGRLVLALQERGGVLRVLVKASHEIGFLEGVQCAGSVTVPPGASPQADDPVEAALLELLADAGSLAPAGQLSPVGRGRPLPPRRERLPDRGAGPLRAAARIAVLPLAHARAGAPADPRSGHVQHGISRRPRALARLPLKPRSSLRHPARLIDPRPAAIIAALRTHPASAPAPPV